MVRKSQKKRMRFSWYVVTMLAVTFVIGGAAGAFMYATGQEVVQTPKMQMVSHTEYAYAAPGQIISRLVDFQGNPVAVNNCTATILYPDKTSFVSAALMTASNIPGDFYYNFTTPNGPEGTYEYQATCYYGVNKNASVTNSFHLTPNFNLILSNLTSVQGNLTALSAQLNTNISTVLSELQNTNSTLYAAIQSVNTSVANVNTAMGNNFTALDSAMGANFTQLQANVTQILTAISNISVTTNLTPVLDAIATVNSTVNNIQSTMAANFTYTNGLITAVNSSLATYMADVQTNFSTVINYLDYINTTVSAIDYTAALAEINTTTQNTYTYLTGTLTTNVNSILSQLGVMNATLNRIETNTVDINSTVNTIRQNQEDAVVMSVFSG